jgi:tetratricopeptide (TPR) repeat protein
LRLRVWSLVLFVWSLVLAFTPGFGALEYYFALAAALPVALGAGHCAIGIAASARAHAPPLPGTLVLVLRALASAAWLAALPLAVISLNAARVKNCDAWNGLGFYAMGPLLSALYASLVGLALGLAVRSSRRATAALALVVVASLLWHLVTFLTEPAIFFYNPFFGYWSGAIYDEVIGIRGPYGLYRLNNLAQALTIVAALAVFRADASGGVSLAAWRAASWWRQVALVLGVGGVLAFQLYRGPLGYEVSREDIQRELGGRHETAHFVIHFPASDNRFSKHIEDIAADHEYRYAQLEALFGEPFPTKIHTYLYSNGTQKRRLMGADRVYIAKPWLHEVHLAPLELGSTTLKHEIAHVYAALYAPPPLYVSSRFGLLPHMGLIEGLATATEGYKGRLTLHEWSAALLELDKLPKLETVMGPEGYWSSAGPTAYTAAGSFLLYLLEQYGVERVKALYRSGDFQETYGRSLSVLTEEWRGFLGDRSRLPIGPGELERARLRYDKKPVFSRTCPLVVAAMEDQAQKLLAKGASEEAIALLRDVERWRDGAPDKKLAVARALGKTGRFDDARAEALAVASHPKAGAALAAQARELVADLAWMTGDAAAAAATYEDLRASPLEQGDFRRLAAKRAALAHRSDRVRQTLRDYLTGLTKETRWTQRLRGLHAEHPDSAIVAYLLGYRLHGESKWGEALVPLMWSLSGVDELPDAAIRAEAHRAVALAWFRLGDMERARASFGRSAAELPPEATGLRAEAQDWQARTEWAERAGRSGAWQAAWEAWETAELAQAQQLDACGCL